MEADLSAPQLKLVSETAAVAEGASGTLLELAEQGASHHELADAAARLRAAARSRWRPSTPGGPGSHRCRHLRWHQRPEGGIGGAFVCDEVAWARVAPRLEAEARRRWKAAGATRTPRRAPARRLPRAAGRGAGRAGRPVGRAAVRGRGPAPHGGDRRRRGAAPRLGPRGRALRDRGDRPGLGRGGQRAVGRGRPAVRWSVTVSTSSTVTGTTRTLPQRMAAALVVRDRTCASKGAGNGTDSKSTTAGSTSPTVGRRASTILLACAPSTTISRPTAAGGWKAGPVDGGGSPPPTRRARATSPGPGSWRRRRRGAAAAVRRE